MAQTKTVDEGFSAGSAYAQSFGSMPDKTLVSDPAGLKNGVAVDRRTAIKGAFSVGLKAHETTSGGPGTAGYAMIPVYVDPRIIDTTRKYTPIVELVPRVTNMGMYADFNIITAKGGAFVQSEDGALAETNTTYDRKSFQIKFLYAVGRVTGPSIAAQPSYVLSGMLPGAGSTGPFTDQSAPNSKQQEVLVKTREMRELEERLIINGDSAGFPNEFDGIVVQMGATNTVAKANTALSLNDINSAVQKAFDDGGRPNLAICDSATYNDILALLTQKIGYLKAEAQVFWGFTTVVVHTMVGSIPIVPSMFLSNTAGAKSVYFLDMSIVEMRVLQDLTYFELARTNDSEKFALKVYECFLIKNPSFCASITAIA
jgi:hypothetical protein